MLFLYEFGWFENYIKHGKRVVRMEFEVKDFEVKWKFMHGFWHRAIAQIIKNKGL